MKKILLAALGACVLLCACGARTTEMDQVQEQYRRIERAEMDAEITCHLTEESRTFTVHATCTDTGAATEVTAPEELAGIRAEAEGDELSVVYDGVSLPAGQAPGVSPANCLPLLLRALEEGYVLEYGAEDIDETPCLRAALETSVAGEKVLYTVWLDRETLVPCYAELSQNGQVTITVRMLSFTWEGA